MAIDSPESLLRPWELSRGAYEDGNLVGFDALLKTFEEAPAHVRFILATTELHKVPATIRSRAQVFHFRPSSRAQVEQRLRQIADAEQAPISDAATVKKRNAGDLISMGDVILRGTVASVSGPS